MKPDEFLADMQGQLTDVWDQIEDDYKEGVKLTSECLVEFLRMAAEGKDVEEDLANVRAQVLNWKCAASVRFQSAFWATAEKVAATLGSAALKALKGAAGLP